MRKALWFGGIVGGVGVVLQLIGGFSGGGNAAFLGYLLFIMSLLWAMLIYWLKELPPSFGDCVGLGICLAMAAGAWWPFLHFDSGCLVWALAFTIWLVAEMALAFHNERERRKYYEA